MKDETRQALTKIINTHGAHIAQDPRLCHAFLRDYRPWDDHEINLLVNSVKSNVPAALRQAPPADIHQTTQRLAQALRTQHGHEPAHALWAVETWAIALKLMNPAQAGRTASPQPPRPAPTPKPRPAQNTPQPNDPPPNWLPSPAPAPAATPSNPSDLWGQTGFGGQNTPAPVESPLTILFSFQGRMSPTRFLWIALPTGVGYPLLCAIVLTAIHLGFGLPVVTSCIAVPLALIMIPATWAFLAASVKRWHDMDISGWRAIFAFVPPIVGHAFTLIIGGLIQGTPGPNRYGDPPID
jgi:uncharacterized membrane protein YhaH (DUF805 family)